MEQTNDFMCGYIYIIINEIITKGTCSYQGLGSCMITLSEPLLKYRTNNELKETLLHEMIHGYLFLTDPQSCKTEEGHGPSFLEIMHNINKQTQLNISVYHQFHDEVDRCRQHIWKCDGICSQRPPFFGIVKRSMNRPPQKADRWFADHQSQCGGQFIKISEPEKVKKEKKTQAVKNSKKKTKSDNVQGIETFLKKNEQIIKTQSLELELELQAQDFKLNMSLRVQAPFKSQDMKELIKKLVEGMKHLSKDIQLQDPQIEDDDGLDKSLSIGCGTEDPQKYYSQDQNTVLNLKTKLLKEKITNILEIQDLTILTSKEMKPFSLIEWLLDFKNI